MFVLLSVVFGFTLSYGFYYDFDYFARAGVPKLDITHIYFEALENYQINAKHISETKYPWIGKVIHSITKDVPYVCTASCIKERVFVTAAKCIITLKVAFTKVIYQNKYHLPVQVFVTPSKPTKQGYDDVGLIVVKIPQETVVWKELQLYSGVNRTDSDYAWFKKLPTEGYMVIGYASIMEYHSMTSIRIPYNLTELKVIIGLDICAKIMTHALKEVYHVPCYHACTVAQFVKKAPECNNYHGVQGGAIIEIKSNKLLGVATWGMFNGKQPFPAGFAVINSENFYKDYKCANAIAKEKTIHTEPLYWQKFCDKL